MRDIGSIVLPRLIAVLAVMALDCASPRFLWAQAKLENPAPDSFQSSIGVISGWKCTAGTITITNDNGPPAQAAYGTSRADTQAVCGGKTNTGFGLLFNWNRLGDGLHTLRAFDNGVQFASAIFFVTTLGKEYLTGAIGGGPVLDFPSVGMGTTVAWQENLQNFVIMNRQPCVETATGTALDGLGGSATFTVKNVCGTSGVYLDLQAISRFEALSGSLALLQGGQTLYLFWLRPTQAGPYKEVEEIVPAGETRQTLALLSPGGRFNPAAPFSVVYKGVVVVTLGLVAVW